MSLSPVRRENTLAAVWTKSWIQGLHEIGMTWLKWSCRGKCIFGRKMCCSLAWFVRISLSLWSAFLYLVFQGISLLPRLETLLHWKLPLVLCSPEPCSTVTLVGNHFRSLPLYSTCSQSVLTLRGKTNCVVSRRFGHSCTAPDVHARTCPVAFHFRFSHLKPFTLSYSHWSTDRSPPGLRNLLCDCVSPNWETGKLINGHGLIIPMMTWTHWLLRNEDDCLDMQETSSSQLFVPACQHVSHCLFQPLCSDIRTTVMLVGCQGWVVPKTSAKAGQGLTCSASHATAAVAIRCKLDLINDWHVVKP